MTNDLRAHDKKASAVIAAVRAKAQAAAASGQPLPSVPQKIRDLQRERTALLVDRFVHVQAGLKPATRSSLDSYLDREFVPHVSMKHLAAPDSSASNERPIFTSGAPQQ